MKINMFKMKGGHKTWYFSPLFTCSVQLAQLRNRSKLWAMIYNSYKYIIIWSVCNKRPFAASQFVAIQRIWNFFTCHFPSFSICRLMWFSVHSRIGGRVGTSRTISTKILSDEVKMSCGLRVSKHGCCYWNKKWCGFLGCQHLSKVVRNLQIFIHFPFDHTALNLWCLWIAG